MAANGSKIPFATIPYFSVNQHITTHYGSNGSKFKKNIKVFLLFKPRLYNTAEA